MCEAGIRGTKHANGTQHRCQRVSRFVPVGAGDQVGRGTQVDTVKAEQKLRGVPPPQCCLGGVSPSLWVFYALELQVDRFTNVTGG